MGKPEGPRRGQRSWEKALESLGLGWQPVKYWRSVLGTAAAVDRLLITMWTATYLKENSRIAADRAAMEVRSGRAGERDFECHGCGIEVRLCSFLETNKVAPYFSVTSDRNEHSEECPVKPNWKGKKGRSLGGTVGTTIIEALVLDDSTDERFPSGHPGPKSKPRKPATRRPGTGSSGRKQGVRAGDLKSVVFEYAEKPYLDSHPLSVPGVEANTYAGCFQQIRGQRNKASKTFSRASFEGRFIYFGRLKFMARPRNRDGLHTFQFIQEASDGTCYQLEIDSRTWSDEETRQILGEIERARSFTRKAWKDAKEREHQGRRRRKKARALAFVFVLAELAEGDNRFQVDDPRLICAVSTEEVLGVGNLRSHNRGRIDRQIAGPSPTAPEPDPENDSTPAGLDEKPGAVQDPMQEPPAPPPQGPSSGKAEGQASDPPKRGLWARLRGYFMRN